MEIKFFAEHRYLITKPCFADAGNEAKKTGKNKIDECNFFEKNMTTPIIILLMFILLQSIGQKKAIPATHLFNAQSFKYGRSDGETEKYYISNIKIIKE